MVNEQEFVERAISVDTEYHTDPTGAIDRVYCVCATSSGGGSYKRWIEEGEEVPTIIEDIAQTLGITDPIYVCHAYDLAERQAFLFLGADPHSKAWLCTYHCGRVIQNAFAYRDPKKDSLSLLSLCKSLLGVEIDSDHKAHMRDLCITGYTEGHEEEIMDYCLEDTVHLIPLALE